MGLTKRKRRKTGIMYRIAEKIFPLIPVFTGEKGLLSLGHTIYWYYDQISKDEDFPKFLQPFQVQRICNELRQFGDVRCFSYVKQGKGNLYIRLSSEYGDMFD